MKKYGLRVGQILEYVGNEDFGVYTPRRLSMMEITAFDESSDFPISVRYLEPVVCSNGHTIHTDRWSLKPFNDGELIIHKVIEPIKNIPPHTLCK